MAASHGFTLFDTPIGSCGIAWRGDTVVGVQLPEADADTTRARLRRRFPEAGEIPPPARLRAVVDAIVGFLEGADSDLAAVPLDMTGVPAFHRRVYEVVRTIPAGSTLSYGDVAAQLGSPRAARAVGTAMTRNPFPLVVPCHRVLAAGGRIGGYSAAGGLATKRRLLAIEGSAAATTELRRRDGDAGLGFDPAAAVAHLRAADTVLGRLIDEIGPFDLPLRRTASLFAALAEAIVYQQLSPKAAATIFARLCALFPGSGARPTAEQLLRVPEEKLRAAGLSRAKLLALRDLARHSRDGGIPTVAAAGALADQAIIDRLTAVRGIGRWTAEMLLIFRLGRPDVLPIDDLGIRKGFAAAFSGRDPTREAIEKRGRRWQPYRTVASWYLWRAAERAKTAPARESGS